MGNSGPDTIGELMILWLESKRAALKQASYATYRHVVETSVIPLIGDIRLVEVSQGVLQNFIGQLYARGMAEKSVWDINSKLNAALRWAAEQNYIEHAGFCVKARFYHMAPPRVLSQAEKTVLQSYLRHSDGERHIKAGVLLCLECGLKIGELCALRFEAVDLKRRLLYVDKRLQRIVNLNPTGKKTEIKSFPVEPRQIPLPQDLAELVRELDRPDPSAFFLTGKADKSMEPRLLQIHFKSYLRICGLDESIDFNRLRASYISSALESGEDLCKVGRIVGAKRLAYIDEKFHPYYNKEIPQVKNAY